MDVLKLVEVIGKLLPDLFGKAAALFGDKSPKAERPLLVQHGNGVCIGAPEWARSIPDWSPGLAISVPSEGRFIFTNQGAAVQYAEIVSPRELFQRIEPATFDTGARVEIIFDAGRYDSTTLERGSKPIPLKLRFVSAAGNTIVQEYQCRGYGVVPHL